MSTTPLKSTYRIAPDHQPRWGIVESFREMWRYRALLHLFVRRQLRMRYKNSSIGMAWSLINPIIQVAVLTTVIGRVLGSGPPNLSAYILCAFLPWSFFSNALLDASSSILANMNTVHKVYVPREFFPISAVLANVVHFLYGLGVFLVYRYVFTTIFFGWPGLPPNEIFLLPVVLLIEIGYVIGFSLILCAWTTFYEDVKFVLQNALGLLFYVLPIVYFAENIFYAARVGSLREKLYHFYLVIPMTWIVSAFKEMFFRRQNIAGVGQPVILSAPFDYRLMAFSAVSSLVVLLVGMAYYNKMKWKFTERP